jgi:hypothetical protein
LRSRARRVLKPKKPAAQNWYFFGLIFQKKRLKQCNACARPLPYWTNNTSGSILSAAKDQVTKNLASNQSYTGCRLILRCTQDEAYAESGGYAVVATPQVF